MVRDPNLVKEIFLKPFEYGKFDVKLDKSKELFGHFGLAAVNGEEWVLHRRILDPAFHMESIKGMVKTMMKCTTSLLQTWVRKVQLGKGSTELEIYNDIRMLTGDIIAYTAFNLNYEKGKQMFAKVDDLVFTITKPYNNPLYWIPGYRFTFLSLDGKTY
jgi:cytochrome P450